MPITACVSTCIRQKNRFFFLALSLLFCGSAFSQSTPKIVITGSVKDSSGIGIATATITEKGTKNAALADASGNFTIRVAGESSVLVFSSVGFTSKEVAVGGQRSIGLSLERSNKDLGEVVVIGYGTRSKQAITGSIATVTSKDIDRVHAGSTVSTGLAGKLPGVTFRQAEGRPGATAAIQIRNFGAPLYVIDGIQQDEAQFNNLAANDIESISVLKDASAAIYGVRAGNGVIVVTTKKGIVGRNNVNVDAYVGGQTWDRFPKTLTNSYDYERFMAEAQVNSNGSTSITQADLDKYKQGASAGPQYRSFDWRSYVLKPNAPQNSFNLNINGGSDKVNYYVSGTHLFQASESGREYKYYRSNITSNVNAQITPRLKVGVNVSGSIETHENPGVPGGDDYFLSRLAILRNTPVERPFANDNPLYLNDLGPHLESNYAFLSYALSGHFRSDKRIVQTNANAEYKIPGIDGLTARVVYSYYFYDYIENNQEYTYKAYTYHPDDQTYAATGGSTNPWRDREQIKQINTTAQAQLNYNNTFGESSVGATFVAERIENEHIRNWIHGSPISNNLPLVYFPIIDQYQDSDDKEARIGYIGRVTYSYANKYFLEASARRDASYLFAPDKRVGYFPGVSAGWRITEEGFMKDLIGNKNVLSDLKLRASYGKTGDDRLPTDATRPIIAPYAYLPGYAYNVGTSIIDGNAVTTSKDQGIPITRVTWLTSKISNIGLDFGFLKSKLTGSLEYFYRKRSGLPGTKYDIVLPAELGYSLPPESLNSDAQYGGEMSLAYTGTVGKLRYLVSGNFSYTRSKFLQSYKPTFYNSLDQYRTSSENRYNNIGWGYVVTGQFTSQDQINNYKINNDGKGNTTLLPGDLIYKDFNGDGKIDQLDQRPIGYGYGTQPTTNFGFSIGLAYSNFDFHADFSGAAGFTWYQNWESRWAFQNNGNLNTIFEDRWHHTNPLDPNSAWVPGKYPANRYNPGFGHSDYSIGNDNGHDGAANSTFWLHNVHYIRARTIELGYTMPAGLLNKVRIQRARFYVNAYNLFSLDNLKQYSVDPEVIDDNSLQVPQNRVLNIGCNLTF